MSDHFDSIRAVFFDLGGTLEDIYYDDDSRLRGAGDLKEWMATRGIDPGLSSLDLRDAIVAGIKRLYKIREEGNREVPPEQIWTEFIFPNGQLPRERLIEIAEELTIQYENSFYTRKLRPEAKATLAELSRRGLRLGVISNVLSRGQVPLNLAKYGIVDNFDAVVASSVFGWRKPRQEIFLEAARLLSLPPSACAYVGDTVSRDVIGARRAGYALAIQIKSFLTTKVDKDTETEKPDVVITDLSQVVHVVLKHNREELGVSN
jgi:putative hydrolase of the HAD superfamily